MSLYEVARSGDIDDLQSWVEDIFRDIRYASEKGAALGVTDAHHLSALHYTVKYNHLKCVKLLVENGADVNVRGKNRSTPLHFAARYTKKEEDTALLQYLMYSNADVNATDDNLATPLHYACLQGNEKVINQLLKSKEINPHAEDRFKTQPVHLACAGGSITIIKMLLEHKADILAENEAKMNAIHVACSHGHLKLVEYLFDILQEQHGIGAVTEVMHKQNIEGQALIHLAALGSHFEVMKYLLERGSDANQVMDDDETVLHVSAVTGHKDILKLLLSHGIEVDKRNSSGRVALHKAARFGKQKVVDLLLKHGADVNALDSSNLTPLILASSGSGNARTIQMLINNGADIKLRDKEDRTALHMAVQNEFSRGVKALLNADNCKDIINMADKDYNTPLHIACANGYEAIAIMLLENNADVQSRNNDSKTPLHLAAFYGQNDVVDNIVEKNASTINDFDQEGNAALHLAAMNGHTAVLKYLLKCGAVVNDKNVESLTPLDCAAKYGQTEAVKVLIWGGAAVHPSNENGLGPLHLSCIEGHSKTVTELLNYCEIAVRDSNGKNPLDLAIDNRNRDAAIAILNHRDWMLALRNKTVESDNTVTTPFRKMIHRMPELASFTLDRCVQDTKDFPNDHPNYGITLKYEFLDDIYYDWTSDFVRQNTDEGDGKGELYTKEKIQKKMEMKDTHTLSYMIRYRRKDLLSHPLCVSMIERKWQKFASKLYYFKLLLYIVFLTFLTGYLLVSAPLREPYRDSDCTIIVQDKTWEMIVFVMIGKYMVLFLALVHILFEVFQMIGQGLHYFEIENLLEWTIYVLAILNVIDDFITLPVLDSGFLCGEYQKSIGAVCVFLAWCNFILFIRKFPKIGIFIVMFLGVTSTFFQFFIVFTFLILAFGFSFFILLHDEKSIPSFNKLIHALVKTGVMMTGGLNFDDFFFADHKPNIVTWILFILFILIMMIVLMNLLVGLAVGDIQAMQKEAELKKATMQIDICLDSETTLPKYLRKKFIVESQVIYPNDFSKLPSNISKETISDLRKIVRTEKEAINQLQDGLNNLQTSVTSISTRLEDIDDHIDEMQALNVKLDDIASMLKNLLEHQQRRRKRPKKTLDDESKADPEVEDGAGGDQVALGD